MLNFRNELAKIKERKSCELYNPKEKGDTHEKYKLEEFFEKLIIPYFDSLSLKEIEAGVELFVHYHEGYFLMGANKTLLCRENSPNMGHIKNMVEYLKDQFKSEGFSINEFSDGFSVIIKA